MFKLFILACFLAVAAASPKPEPGVLAAYTAPYAYAPYAYSAYTAPVAAYSAYTAPVAYSPYTYSPYAAAYYLRR